MKRTHGISSKDRLITSTLTELVVSESRSQLVKELEGSRSVTRGLLHLGRVNGAASFHPSNIEKLGVELQKAPK